MALHGKTRFPFFSSLKCLFLSCLEILQLFPSENLLYLARKEQCLALGTQLRTFKINDYKIYRIFPNSEVQYLHPKDGVFPEKLNEGRVGVGNVGHSIGKNLQPVNVKFTGKNTFD